MPALNIVSMSESRSPRIESSCAGGVVIAGNGSPLSANQPVNHFPDLCRASYGGAAVSYLPG